jgi:uncharacterized protein
MQILLFVAIGLTVGSVSGVLGIGGGVLLVPALMWLCDYDAYKATGTSLAILIPPIGLPAALAAYQRNQVDLPAAVWIAGAFMLGAYASRTLVGYISEEWCRFAFGLLLIVLGMRFVLNSHSLAAAATAGLTAALATWLGYLGLKALGRRHLPPPTVGSEIQKKHEQNWGQTDYQI